MKVTAQAQRSGGWWAIEVPEVPGVFTQAKRLEQVPAVVADAVATMLDDLAAEDLEIDVVPVLDDEISSAVADAMRLAGEAQVAQVAASAAMRLAAHLLRENVSLSVRDVAAVLRVSHQRVSQLVDSFDSSVPTTDVEVAATVGGAWEVKVVGAGAVGGLFASQAAAMAAGRDLVALAGNPETVVRGSDSKAGRRRSDGAAARG